MGGALESSRIPHVDVERCDVEVARDNYVVGRGCNGVYVLAQLLHPAKFVLIVLVIKFAAVGHVHAHHFGAAACCADDARVGVGVAHSKVLHHVGKPNFGQDGNAVPLPLAEVRTFVTHLGKHFGGKHFLLHFGFLHAQHVGLGFF